MAKATWNDTRIALIAENDTYPEPEPAAAEIAGPVVFWKGAFWKGVRVEG